MVLSVVYFAVVMYLLGLGTVRLATGRRQLTIETHVMATGVGIGTFAVLATVFNLLGVPLAWWTFLAAAILVFSIPSFRDLILKKSPPPPTARQPSWSLDMACLVGAVGITAVLFAGLLYGSFNAPWLPDEDPVVHAISAKYISVHGTYSSPPGLIPVYAKYLEPYPSTYPTLMGVLVQLNPSVVWTLKFFNALLVSLSVLYFYIMAKEWTGKGVTALWMAGLIAICPCFMSRFIWAHTLAVLLFFPAFYALERIRAEPRWGIVAAVLIGAVLTAQPSAPAAFVFLAVGYWVVNVAFAWRKATDAMSMRSVVTQALSGAGGVLVALIYFLPGLIRYGLEDYVVGYTREPFKGFKFSFTGGETYGLWDFIWSDPRGRIDQPTGFGIVLFAVVCAGVVLSLVRARHLLGRRFRVVALVWLLVCVVNVEGNALPVAFFSYRFWVFLAMAAAMIAGEFLVWLGSPARGRSLLAAVVFGLALGVTLILSGLPETVFGLPRSSMGTPRLAAMVLAAAATTAALAWHLLALVRADERPLAWTASFGVAALLAGIVLTSGYPKVSLESIRRWGPSIYFYHSNEMAGWVDIRSRFPPGTPVLALTSGDDRVIAFDMWTPPFDPEVRAFGEALKRLPVEQIDQTLPGRIRDFAVSRRFGLVVVDQFWAGAVLPELLQVDREITGIARGSGLSGERLNALLQGDVRPTPEEKPVLEAVMECLGRRRERLALLNRELEKTARLRERMNRSPYFQSLLDSGQNGLTLFRVLELPAPVGTPPAPPP